MAWDNRHARDPPSRISAPDGRYGGPSEDDRTGVNREEDEEQWGPIGSMLWYVVAGGKQCCSMRDRTKPSDQEAARRASETGRPPKSGQFPEPPIPAGRSESSRPAMHNTSYPMMADRYDSGAGFPADDDDDDLNPYSASREVPPPVPPSREDDREPEPRGGSKPTFKGPETQAAGAVAKPADDSPPRVSNKSQASIDLSLNSLTKGRESGGGGAMPKRWEWPPWCLNFKEPCIEVLVEDEDGGQSRWVEAEPQSRVVDKAGRDAYLCAEYEWDGEFYVQDFGPQHVRRRGQKTTVFELFVTMKGKGGDGELNKSRDQGGGVMAFLND